MTDNTPKEIQMDKTMEDAKPSLDDIIQRTKDNYNTKINQYLLNDEAFTFLKRDIVNFIRVVHESAYSLGYTCGQVDNSYYEEHCWQTFKTENQL